jgi:sugar phosphate isomerase/epimerase
MPPTRREFLAAAAAGTVAVAAAAIEPIGRTRPSHLKLSLAAYSYRHLLEGPNRSMDLFAFADLAADMGLDAIEPTSYYFPPDAGLDECHRLRRHAFRLGLDISGTAVRNDFCLAPGPARPARRAGGGRGGGPAASLAGVRDWVDRAVAMQAPVIRIFAGRVPPGDTEAAAVARAIEGLRESVGYAGTRGVTLALENHGGITATPAQLLRLVEAVDSPWFGVNLDTGNFRTPDPYADLERIAPYAVNVQVKTEITRSDAEPKEPADLARLVEMLRRVRYSGYVVLEYEAAEDPLTAIPSHVAELRRLIA